MNANAVVLAVLLSSGAARAQVRPVVRVLPPPTPSASAGAPLIDQPAIAESLVVLKQLQHDTGKNRKDAAAWYRQGQIAALLFERCLHLPPAKGLDCTRPRMLADSAFLIARELEPTNRDYILALGGFLLQTDATYYRDGTYFVRLFDDAMKDARKTGDPKVYADAALDMGRYFWLQYEAKSHRRWDAAEPAAVRGLAAGVKLDSVKRAGGPDPDNTGLGLTHEELRRARSRLDGRLHPQGEYSGEIEYLLAQISLTEAFRAAPTDLRAYRAYGTLLAERDRWAELASVAKERIRVVPGDGWAWMTHGLALYRRGDTKYAETAFDSALVLLGPDERARLDRIDRVLGVTGKRNYAAADSVARAAAEKMFWLMNDPLWTRDDDQPRPEFLARVAYAELVWTADERNQRGADSDRGSVYIKFGPPDRIWSYRCSNSEHFKGMESSLFDDGPRCGSAGTDTTSSPRQVQFDPGWTHFQYDFSNRDFAFRRVLTYLTMHLTTDSLTHANLPASFDNLVRGRIDSIPVQLARFRATADSTDVIIASLPPTAAIAQSAAIAGPVRTDEWLMTMAADFVLRDSVKSSATGIRTRTYRVENGTYIYRQEMTGEGALVAGRATWAFVADDDPRTGFRTNGFGMSDILVATKAEPRTLAPRRWSDFTVSPVAGPLPSGADVSVLWETYDLANDNGRARYGIHIAIKRPRADTSTTPNIAAKIVNGIAGAIGFQQKEQKDLTEFNFDREVAHAATIVDNVALSLGTTPPGNYLLTLEITDRGTGKLVGRSQQLIIVPARR